MYITDSRGVMARWLSFIQQTRVQVPLLLIVVTRSISKNFRQKLLLCIRKSPYDTGHIVCMNDNADAKRIPSTIPLEDWRSQGHPGSHGWAPSRRIWDPIISHCLKQWIWPRTGLCGGCGQRTVLHNTVACQKQRTTTISHGHVRMYEPLLMRAWMT